MTMSKREFLKYPLQILNTHFYFSDSLKLNKEIITVFICAYNFEFRLIDLI